MHDPFVPQAVSLSLSAPECKRLHHDRWGLCGENTGPTRQPMRHVSVPRRTVPIHGWVVVVHRVQRPAARRHVALDDADVLPRLRTRMERRRHQPAHPRQRPTRLGIAARTAGGDGVLRMPRLPMAGVRRPQGRQPAPAKRLNQGIVSTVPCSAAYASASARSASANVRTFDQCGRTINVRSPSLILLGFCCR